MTDGQTDRQTIRHIDRQTDPQIDRQTNTDKQADCREVKKLQGGKIYFTSLGM